MRKRRATAAPLTPVDRGALDRTSTDLCRTAPLTPDPRARPQPPDAKDLLRVTARAVDGRRRVVLEVAGEVDHYTAPLLTGCLRAQCERGGLRDLVVDMVDVTFLGGAGLAALADARRRCSARGVRLAVWCSGRSAVLRPLQVAGLSGLCRPIEPRRPGVAPPPCWAPLAWRKGSDWPRRLPRVTVVPAAARRCAWTPSRCASCSAERAARARTQTLSAGEGSGDDR